MKIGFIGLGIMGKPMAKNLLKAGHEVVCYDIAAQNVADVVAAGAKAAASCKAVAGQCTIVITMLPNSPHVKEAVMGPGGVLEGAKTGTILIDMSSIAPQGSQEIEKACSAKVASVGTMKPFNYQGAEELARDMKGVVTAEEHSYIGGLAAATAFALRCSSVPMDYVALNDTFGESAHKPEDLQTTYGLTAENIAEKARNLLKKRIRKKGIKI